MQWLGHWVNMEQGGAATLERVIGYLMGGKSASA